MYISMTDSQTRKNALATVTQWIETVVIGLNLCPFAGPVVQKGGLNLQVWDGRDLNDLVEDVTLALSGLAAAGPDHTSIIVLTEALADFSDYNDFLGILDAVIEDVGLSGVIQIASFHPDYCFAEHAPDDVANYTNRAPYPLIHLLRENDVSHAVDNVTDTLQIPIRNVTLMRELGQEQMLKLLAACRQDLAS